MRRVDQPGTDAMGRGLVAEGVVLRAGRSVSVTRVDVHVLAGSRPSLCAALQQGIMRAPATPPAA